MTTTYIYAQRSGLHIAALDHDWTLKLSTFTKMFYVKARIDIADGGGLIGSITQHDEDPSEAIIAYFNAMIAVKAPKYLVTECYNDERRRHWRWNGVTFAEIARTS